MMTTSLPKISRLTYPSLFTGLSGFSLPGEVTRRKEARQIVDQICTARWNPRARHGGGLAYYTFAVLEIRYQRYTREIGRGYLPPFRGRKWSGNAVYEWRGGDVTPEYGRVLQEVRRLWQAQASAKSAVASHQTSIEFYRTLVPEPLSR